jgi:hypothetical protein
VFKEKITKDGGQSNFKLSSPRNKLNLGGNQHTSRINENLNRINNTNDEIQEEN